jgi:hypothetical protein
VYFEIGTLKENSMGPSIYTLSAGSYLISSASTTYSTAADSLDSSRF